jgi:phosphopantothenoylcysteine decarboxylase/phosphopantothenate--cysteine ligase
MGFAIAEALANLGATVKLITGPVSISTTHLNIDTIKVRSAEEMSLGEKPGGILCTTRIPV